MKRTVASLMMALGLAAASGCSSVQELNFYQLPQQANTVTSASIDAAVIVVEPVMVANYLNTNALILQTSDVQLVKTNQQQWAEALDQQLTRLLQQQLTATLPGHRVTDRAPQGPQQRLLVQVEQFHGTEQGMVLISGKYSLVNGEQTIQQRFALELAQPEAGYPSMVATLGAGWQQVVTEISQLFKPDVLKVKSTD
ncbi:MAG: membrane integrity-associated transporter subunit PqiC [Rheinheimera sp.]